MKKIIVLMFLTLCLYGCSKEQKSIDTTYTLLGNIAMNEDGFYTYHQDERLIYYYDAKTDTYVPLCNRPNCNHDVEECNAFALTHYKNDTVLETSPTYYNNSLYFLYRGQLDLNYYLCKANQDGSNRELIAELDHKDLLLQGVMFFHGKMIYAANAMNMEPDENDSTNMLSEFYLKEVDLDSGEQAFLSLGENKKELFHPMGAYEDVAYFISFKEDDSSDFIGYNVVTKESKVMKRNISETLRSSFVVDGHMYYMDFEDQGFKDYHVLEDTEELLDTYAFTGDKEDMNASVIQGVLLYVWELEGQRGINPYYYDCITKKSFVSDDFIVGKFKDKYIVEKRENGNKTFELKSY